jgi:hypothetical protein
LTLKDICASVMVYKSHGIYVFKVYIKRLNDEGLHGSHVSLRKDYVLGLYMLGTSGYKV